MREIQRKFGKSYKEENYYLVVVVALQILCLKWQVGQVQTLGRGCKDGGWEWVHLGSARQKSSGWIKAQTWREQVVLCSWRSSWQGTVEHAGGEMNYWRLPCLALPSGFSIELPREGEKEGRKEGGTNSFFNWTKWISLHFLSNQICVMMFAFILLTYLLCLHCSSLKHFTCLMWQI